MKKSKKEKLSVAERLSNAANLPIDMAGSRPFIRIFSNREIVIEDAGRLVAYSEECISVRQHKNLISVCGCDLKLVCLSNGDLRVTGFIKSVCFE